MAQQLRPDPKQTTATHHEPISAKKRLLALLLAAFYSVIILSLSLVVGNFLYNCARNCVAFTSPVLLNGAGQDSSGKDVGALAPGAGQAETQNNSGPDTSGEEAVPMPQRQVTILLLGTDERSDDPEPPRTDTMMLLTLNLENRTAGMISQIGRASCRERL